jgi:hypothetical protein
MRMRSRSLLPPTLRTVRIRFTCSPPARTLSRTDLAVSRDGRRREIDRRGALFFSAAGFFLAAAGFFLAATGFFLAAAGLGGVSVLASLRSALRARVAEPTERTLLIDELSDDRPGTGTGLEVDVRRGMVVFTLIGKEAKKSNAPLRTRPRPHPCRSTRT